ncbi:MAG TPA: hypothetical protein DCK98_09040 [Chloroflexi bacterium]|nr:hypothetical protein [Chloroflexota bacterium]HAL25959.1 hypothetical protein [Chloroflexota bacterium]
MRPIAALALLAIVVSGCASPATVTASASPSAAASATASPAADTEWPTYHRDNARTGTGAAGPPFTSVDMAWQSGTVDGDVYAAPIIAGGSVIVATERNSVYAFDARSGATQWRATLGPPVDASTLPCGNIRPVTGITGTPVADPAAGLVYVVAFEQPAHHELYALDLASGAVRAHRTVDGPGSDPQVHQERAALTLANGFVYVAFGGLAGDCGQYHGWVVGARAGSLSGDLVSYQVPSPREAGIWAPSGLAVDVDGRLFVAIGNGADAPTYSFSNAVVRLSPELRVEDWWAPSDWQSLDRTDSDIGSIGPTLLPGAIVVAAGKSGTLYTLRAADLGHTGAEIAKERVCAGVYGGFAFAAGVLYVPCTDGPAAVQVGTDGALRSLWRGPRAASGPPIVVAGAVWAVDPAAGTVYALDPASGQVRVQRQLGAMQHFTTLAAFGTEILVAAGGRLVALLPR